MLFSRADVTSFINKYFEPAWESVRSVPLVRIDFGSGRVVTRTLHGNIATSVCTAKGEVLDIVPGIYTPEVYFERLRQFRLLANYMDQGCKRGQDLLLRSYHQGQAEAIKKNTPPDVLVNVAPITKSGIEAGIKAVLVPGKNSTVRTYAGGTGHSAATSSMSLPDEDQKLWKALAEDTRVNESLRRLQIHELLTALGLTRPESLTRVLYKTVLDTDLDDPYLGLAKLLNTGYPFKDGSR